MSMLPAHDEEHLEYLLEEDVRVAAQRLCDMYQLSNASDLAIVLQNHRQRDFDRSVQSRNEQGKSGRSNLADLRAGVHTKLKEIVSLCEGVLASDWNYPEPDTISSLLLNQNEQDSREIIKAIETLAALKLIRKLARPKDDRAVLVVMDLISFWRTAQLDKFHPPALPRGSFPAENDYEPKRGTASAFVQHALNSLDRPMTGRKLRPVWRDAIAKLATTSTGEVGGNMSL